MASKLTIVASVQPAGGGHAVLRLRSAIERALGGGGGDASSSAAVFVSSGGAGNAARPQLEQLSHSLAFVALHSPLFFETPRCVAELVEAVRSGVTPLHVVRAIGPPGDVSYAWVPEDDFQIRYWPDGCPYECKGELSKSGLGAREVQLMLQEFDTAAPIVVALEAGGVPNPSDISHLCARANVSFEGSPGGSPTLRARRRPSLAADEIACDAAGSAAMPSMMMPASSSSSSAAPAEVARWSATAKEEAEAGAAPLYVPPVSRIYCDNKPAAEKSSFKKVMFSAARRRSTSTPMPRPPKGMQ